MSNRACAVVCLLLVFLALLLPGCGSHRPTRIKIPSVGSVVGVVDQGKPAELEQTKVETSVEIPKGSTVVSEPATGKIEVRVSEPTVLTQVADIVAATTGSIDTEVAEHRITQEAKAGVTRNRMYVGIFLLLAGLIIGFALPPGLRWPMVGVKVAGVGALLTFIPDPPTWLIAALAAAAVAVIYTFYVKRHTPPTQ